MFNDNLLRDQLQDIVYGGALQLSNIKPSAWVEQNIVMGQPFPGPFRYTKTPYAREIIDCLAPDHPARWVAVMKGLQIGISAGVIIPGLGYIIKEQPANTYFTVGAPDLVDKSVEKLDLMIDRANLRQYIKPQVKRIRNSKSGDTNSKKDFSGGFINITTANNHKEWRDVSLKYGFIDDFEAAKSASKESGSTRKLIEGRFAAYKDTHKIFYISTPELKETSNIEPAYLLGDQRKYLIPCPCCHEFIELRLNVTDGLGTIWKEPMPEGAGLVWELDNAGRVIDGSVGYVCPLCAGYFKDNHKQQFLNDGRWHPSAEPSQMGYYSYHISSLYAPAGMYDWKHYAHNYVECHPQGQARKEAEYKTFINTCLGITYEGAAEAPKATSIMKNIRDYEVNEIPERLSIADGNGRIVLLTCGSDMNGKFDDARLDWEILAHSETGATYSIAHGSIGTFIPRQGQKVTDRAHWTYEHNMPNSVWPEFAKIITQNFKTDTGRDMSVYITALDVGAYAQAGGYPFLDWCFGKNINVIGVKGDKEEKYMLLNKDIRVHKKSLERPLDMYILQVGLIKDRLAEYMNLRWDKDEAQPANFMNYPQPSDGLYQYSNYFEHYEAEHRTTVTNKDSSVSYRWQKKNSAVQNHLFDCRIYNMAIRDIMLSQFAEEWKVKDLTWQEWVAAAVQYIK